MRKKPYRFLFLYSRLPDYFFRCIQYLIATGPKGSEARIVCYPKNEDAPYHFADEVESIQVIPKKDLTAQSVNDWQPDLIYIAGWGDKVYNRIAESWVDKVPVIIGMDNPWKGTVKQKLAVLFAQAYLKKKATHLWVPGYPQYEFARRIGFPANRILHGLYCADINKWKRTTTGFQKRILYVGRMVSYKRPEWLLEAFKDIILLHPELEEWELLMIGNGPLMEGLKTKYGHLEQIEFRPFIQPAELISNYHESAIFCMPSLYEHWGVVVQEAATAGLSLLLSDTCGAASAFLISGYNGFTFQSGDKKDFVNKLIRLMKAKPLELKEMGEKSEALSLKITQDAWCGNLMSVLDDR